jgi:hypothetical protein
MKTYLIPAMLRVDAEDETRANDLAGDVVASNLTGHGIYLDEQLPTVEIVGCDIEWEFPHSMLDERIAPTLFPQPAPASMFTVVADVDGWGSRMDAYAADTPALAFAAFMAEHAANAEQVSLIAVIAGEHTDRRNEVTDAPQSYPGIQFDLEA